MKETERPNFYQFYVFWSVRPEPTAAERGAGVYLAEMAEARYLQKFFSPLYRSVGLGISTSDDELVSGNALDGLGEAVVQAIGEVQAQPEQWLVVVGHTFEPFQQTGGAPIARYASKPNLLHFLERVATMIGSARAARGHLHFCGGG